MRELNKFQVITVAFILVFLFVVGAIYSNTREMAENNAKTQIKEKNAEYNKEIHSEQKNINTENVDINELNDRVNELSDRVNNINNSNSNSNRLNCRIRGIMGDSGIEQLSDDASLNEARVNGRELVLTCSF